MKNWNDFLQEFVLRAMTNNVHQEYFSPSDAARLAGKAWDAIQAAEEPESEKAKQAPIAANSPDLRAIARKALEVSGNNAGFVAIDASGGVYAYDLRPECYEIVPIWDNTPDQGFNWFVCVIAPPEDFTKELYEISKILSDDL